MRSYCKPNLLNYLTSKSFRIREFIKDNLTLSFFVTTIITIFLSKILIGPLIDVTHDLLTSKPHIVFNVTENSSFDTSLGISEMQLNNDLIAYKTFGGRGYLAVFNAGNWNLSKQFGSTILEPDQIMSCPQCTEYSFALKNLGNVTAENVEIDFLSTIQVQINPSSSDPKITSNKDRIMNGIREYHVVIDNIPTQGQVSFACTVKGFKGDGIRNVRCRVNGIESYCSINYMTFHIADGTKISSLKLNNRIIQLPVTNQSKVPIDYMYDQKAFIWKQVPSKD